MNRKNKKQIITTIVVISFFLLGGSWYLITTCGLLNKQKVPEGLTGVLSVTPQKPDDEARNNETVPKEAEETEQAGELVVYVCGAVNQPGIYTLNAGSRLYEAIALAGGFSAEAAPAYHNLARSISDGERIYILSAKELELLTVEQQTHGENGEENPFMEGNSLINLNTATAEQLMTLSGIGEAKAKAILEYRKKVGQFTDIEEIKNVSGIGEAMFERIKDKIIVK